MQAQSKLSTEKGHISFYSKAPIADVDAHNENVKIELNAKSGELAIDMKMSDFQFKSEKMEKDAEKKYLETGKFTTAGFKGKVEGKVDYDKAGSYTVVAMGKIKVHGVERDFRQKGTVIVGGKGQTTLKAEFTLALKDFNIATPEILGKKMTEESVKVTLEAIMTEGTSDTASERKN